MVLVRWLLMLAGAVGLVAEQIWDRKRLQRLRAARQQWKATERALSPAERQEVARAVRRGRAVDDPWLADAAIDLASSGVAWLPRSPLRRVNEAIFAAWWLTAPVIAGMHHRWGWMVVLSIIAAGFLALPVWSRRYARAAEEALLANRRIPPPPRLPEHETDTATLPGVGLPRSVAKARRRAATGDGGPEA